MVLKAVPLGSGMVVVMVVVVVVVVVLETTRIHRGLAPRQLMWTQPSALLQGHCRPSCTALAGPHIESFQSFWAGHHSYPHFERFVQGIRALHHASS